MQTYISEIKVQEYIPGQPFPGLVAEAPAVPEKDFFHGGFPVHAIVLTDTAGYVAVLPGECMQVGGKDGLGNTRCIGRLPQGYHKQK